MLHSPDPPDERRAEANVAASEANVADVSLDPADTNTNTSGDDSR
jgi:hypothetical protein